MKKTLTYLGLASKDSKFHVWIGQGKVDVLLNDKPTQTDSTRTLRLYTFLKGKKDDVLVVDEANMEPMMLDVKDKDGKVIGQKASDTFYWLKA